MPQKLKTFLLISVVLFVLACITGLILPAHSSGAGINIIPQQESFTELYFNNHSDLPTTAVENQTYSFSFTIHNLTNKKISYLYQVTLSLDGRSRTIYTKNVLLAPDEFRQITEHYTINTLASTARITVNLPHQNQHIDYFITNN